MYFCKTEVEKQKLFAHFLAAKFDFVFYINNLSGASKKKTR